MALPDWLRPLAGEPTYLIAPWFKTATRSASSIASACVPKTVVYPVRLWISRSHRGEPLRTFSIESAKRLVEQKDLRLDRQGARESLWQGQANRECFSAAIASISAVPMIVSVTTRWIGETGRDAACKTPSNKTDQR